MSVAKEKEPRVRQDKSGVHVFRPGRTLRAAGPDRSVVRRVPPPVRCPYCKAEGREGNCRRTGNDARSQAYLYECLECCDPERGQPSRFMVFRRRED